jgi:hypothetical protein
MEVSIAVCDNAMSDERCAMLIQNTLTRHYVGGK